MSERRWKNIYEVAEEQRAERLRVAAKSGRPIYDPTARRGITNVDLAIEQRTREVRAENERRQAAREAGLPDPTRRWKGPLEVSMEQRAERERLAAGAEIQSHPIDTASLETAQQAAQVASSALHFISGILGRGSR